MINDCDDNADDYNADDDDDGDDDVIPGEES